MSNENPFTAVFGIYNANGGIVGELRYLAGKLFGQTHCALCDITHSGISEKKEFKACRESQPVPMQVLHINEQDDDLATFTQGQTPCVVGQRQNGEWVVLLDADALEACHRSVEAFSKALDAALAN